MRELKLGRLTRRNEYMNIMDNQNTTILQEERGKSVQWIMSSIYNQLLEMSKQKQKCYVMKAQHHKHTDNMIHYVY